MLTEYQSASFLESRLFLKLQRAHCSDRLELGVEPRDAHAKLTRKALDAQRLVIVISDSLEGFDDAGCCAAQHRDVTEPDTVGAHQQAIDDLPRDERHEHSRVGRAVD